MEENAESASQSKDAAARSASDALNSKNEAKASETNAKQSENAANASKIAAKESETNAKASETAANSSMIEAANSASAALTSQNAAKNSETKAKNSEDAANASKDAAKASQEAALASQNAAKTSETNAKNSENAANASKSEAARSASDALTSKNAAKASEDKAKEYADSINPENMLNKNNNLNDLADKGEARKNLSVDRLVQGSDASGETVVSSADGTKRIFVKNNGDWGMWDSASNSDIALPVNKGGTGAKDANGIRNNIGLNAQHSPTFSGLSIRTGWPSVVLNSTSVDETYIGRRIYAENNRGNELNIFFAKESDNTDRRTIVIERPNTTERRYVSYEGGLAIGGTSVPGYTAANMNEAHQGWRNWGGTGTGTPQSGNVYGSLFTQCSQGLSAGRANNVGTRNKWYQQRFYDTSNRIFSRIQTNDSSWSGWVQLTTSAVSDERLKDVMGDMNVECALDNINRMEFKLFKFKEEHTTKKNAGATRRGVISQQIRAIDKEYTKDVGGFWHLDQTPMLLDGLAAIKALRARDVENKERIDNLEREVDELKSMVAKLVDLK
ncbi:hypothetical protein vBEcoS95_90 [Escherichia phage vB_EcoS-95]|uniref:Peptidase S74 domain-containing protein n=1 Tax=Escherichia phage vB_EcoS-95 TaxID=2026130 RepID=A0A3S5XAG0_9CAUD|nr:tail fiber protein [Escherichia phage vB_EcoS-95]ASV44893.1 hypothetical protein vBEcoS95_90 [Escherichia phage vB_EcoS-95]